MKFSNQALERLNRMVSMKILAGPTRFNGIESMYSASKGEEACSSDMVAQVIDDPSIGPQSVFVDWTKHEDFIIDTGVTQHFVPEMLDYDTHDILNSNSMQVTVLASSVGQVQGVSVTTLEHAFAVNNFNWTHVHSRNKKRNAQLGPPIPEGSDAGHGRDHPNGGPPTQSFDDPRRIHPSSDRVNSVEETHLNHLKEKTKALKHAARVLVQAHQLARTPAHCSHRKEFSTLTQIAIDMANEVHPYGLEALMKCSSDSSMRKKKKFQYRGTRNRYT
ncbi:hypothetical protein IV203_027062 [Nitzschia inconspicua]|uniref:Uncharacterized protein n=1 Tax=Nitzschia inconspicua TaxID=303405 RepID=A0A9K3PY22_9STRA|nr:hypothetical protein IV203_027062 [Nitzschia inconspicua]